MPTPRQRHIMVKYLLELCRNAALPDWPFDDAMISWAIRLAAYEGRPADMPWLIGKTGLARSTIQRRLEANVRAGTMAVTTGGKRKHYRMTPKADALVAEHYPRVHRIFRQWAEEEKL